MLTHTKYVVFAILFAMVATSVAYAQAPSKKQTKQAANLVRKARKAKLAGDRFARKAKTQTKSMARYKTAAVGYLNAYTLVGSPKIVFRLAEIYRARGETAWALRGYYHYIELEPMGEFSDASETSIAEINEELAGEEAVDGDGEIDPIAVFGPPPVPIVDTVEEKPPDVTPKPKANPKPIVTVPSKKKEPTSSPGRVLRIGGIGTAILGATAIGLGIKFGLDASSASDALSSKTGPWTEADRTRISDGESSESKALLFSLLGTAGIIGGGVLYYMGSRRSEGVSGKEAQSRLVPTMNAGGATITWLGSF